MIGSDDGRGSEAAHRLAPGAGVMSRGGGPRAARARSACRAPDRGRGDVDATVSAPAPGRTYRRASQRAADDRGRVGIAPGPWPAGARGAPAVAVSGGADPGATGGGGVPRVLR